MKIKAFTLAEVLITLGIIGIVAALTLPAVSTRIAKSEATARLKKFNSMMYQVIMQTEQVNEPTSEWNTSNDDMEEFFLKYFAPYMKYVEAKTVSGRYTVYFADGSSLLLRRGDCLDFYFDINGAKKPNTYGKDLFLFSSCGGRTHWCNGRGWCATTKTSDDTREKKKATCISTPNYCGALLEYDNWEFKDDYPW